MKQAVLVGAKKSEIREVEIPKIQNETELLVRNLVCGMCASELHDWQEGNEAGERVFGHEVVGVVEAVGERVNSVKVGDRVTGVIIKGFSEYSVVEEELVCLVPENLTDEEAIGEPIGCLMSGAERTESTFGDKVGVIGLGYMGLGFLQLMKAKGAGTLTAFDVREDALENAKKFGATKAYHVAHIPEELRVITFGENKGRGFDVLAEVSGTQSGIDLAGELVAVHGIMSIVGYHQGAKRSIDMQMWNWKAFSVINAHERRFSHMLECIRRGLILIEEGILNTKDMMTHCFKLEDIDEAFQVMVDKPENYIKAYIRISER